MKQKVLILVGPTSSGKSALAVELARKFNGEVISADSRQVYRGLNVGTGKITKREMRGVPHHLLDVASPKKVFTAQDFLKHGRKACSSILRNTRIPIIVGGTGFYIDALVGRITLANVPVDKKLRARLEKKTPPQLFALLQRKDPRRAKVIDRHNPHRLIRALEIASHTKGAAYTKAEPLYDVLWLGIALPREALNKKIDARLRSRIRGGMVAEAKRLRKKGLSFKRMKELGLEYRVLASLLQKKTTEQKFEQQLSSDIKHFAKRQMTYWRRNKDIKWIELKNKEKFTAAVRQFLL